MQENTINVKAESFPWQARAVGIVFFIGGIAMLPTLWLLGAILLLCALVLLTGHSGTIFNRSGRTFLEYDSYLFIRNGKPERYNAVEKIYINAGKEGQTMYTAHTTHGSTFVHTVYNAYLKFDDGRKMYLTSGRNKSALIKRLEPVAAFLETWIQDNTGE